MTHPNKNAIKTNLQIHEALVALRVESHPSKHGAHNVRTDLGRPGPNGHLLPRARASGRFNGAEDGRVLLACGMG